MAKQKWIGDDKEEYEIEEQAVQADVVHWQGLVKEQEKGFLSNMEQLRRDAKMWETRYTSTLDEAAKVRQQRISDSHARARDDDRPYSGGTISSHP